MAHDQAKKVLHKLDVEVVLALAQAGGLELHVHGHGVKLFGGAVIYLCLHIGIGVGIGYIAKTERGTAHDRREHKTVLRCLEAIKDASGLYVPGHIEPLALDDKDVVYHHTPVLALPISRRVANA